MSPFPEKNVVFIFSSDKAAPLKELPDPLRYILTLIWVGFLGVRFDGAWGRGGKITPPPSGLKLVKIMLEASNLARKYTLICSFRKYTF